MDDADEQQGEIPLSAAVKLGLILCTAGILLTGLFSWVYDYIATQVM
jgi:hypothetical protein